MERHHHIFLVDISKSMKPIHESGRIMRILDGIVFKLRNDPWLVGRVKFSIFAYSNELVLIADQIEPVEISKYQQFSSNFGTIECKSYSNLGNALCLLRELLKGEACVWLPTLCVISGLPSNKMDISLLNYIDTHFAVGIGIEDDIIVAGESIKNWRNGAVVITSDNNAVLKSYRDISDKILCYENIDATIEKYISWAKE